MTRDSRKPDRVGAIDKNQKISIFSASILCIPMRECKSLMPGVSMANRFIYDNSSLKNLTVLVYVLYAASFLAGVTAIVAIIINYVKKSDVAGTIFESHFRWQIRTFWFGLLWSVLGATTSHMMAGWVILGANGIWFIYRIVKGLLYLNDGRPMYPVY
jgi:uncharacterized membrane protein